MLLDGLQEPLQLLVVLRHSVSVSLDHSHTPLRDIIRHFETRDKQFECHISLVIVPLAGGFLQPLSRVYAEQPERSSA